MTYIETRNRKIEHLVKSSISDFCQLCSASYEIEEGIIIVSDNDGSPSFYVYAEYNENCFEIIVKTFVYDNLPLSETMKLREVYRADNIINFLSDNKMLLHFYEEDHLLTAYSFEWDYKNYALLKSKLIIEIYTQLQNASEIRQALGELLEEGAVVGAN